MSEEIWKDVIGYEGIYEVSSRGQIKTVERKILKSGNKGSIFYQTIPAKVREIKTKITGYKEIAFSDGKRGKMTHRLVHRIVAQAFIPNPNNLPEVHHINHDRGDNRVENLKWVTSKENIQEAIKAGRPWGNFKIGIEHHNAKYSDEFVLNLFELEKQGFKRSEIASMTGCSRPYVTDILKNNKRDIAKIYVKTI